MSAETDLTDVIADVAANPAEIEADGQKVKEHSLPDLVAADRHLAAREAASKANRGLRITQLIPPGA